MWGFPWQRADPGAGPAAPLGAERGAEVVRCHLREALAASHRWGRDKMADLSLDELIRKRGVTLKGR